MYIINKYITSKILSYAPEHCRDWCNTCNEVTHFAFDSYLDIICDHCQETNFVQYEWKHHITDTRDVLISVPCYRYIYKEYSDEPKIASGLDYSIVGCYATIDLVTNEIDYIVHTKEYISNDNEIATQFNYGCYDIGS